MQQPETRLDTVCDVSVVCQRSCQQPGQARTEIGLLIRPKSERAPSPDSRTYHCAGGALGGHVQLHVASGAGGPSIHQSSPALGAELHPASCDAAMLSRCRCADCRQWQGARRRLESQNRTSLSTHVSEPGRNPFSLCSPTSGKVAADSIESGSPWLSASETVGKVWQPERCAGSLSPSLA